MKQEVIEEFKSPALDPKPEDYAFIRKFVREREEHPYPKPNTSEIRRFWRAIDRIMPGANRWDYRLATFMAGALFCFGIQLFLFLLIDLFPCDRTWLQRAAIRMEGFLNQPTIFSR